MVGVGVKADEEKVAAALNGKLSLLSTTCVTVLL